MAIVSMANATSGGIASSAEYNKVVANIVDLDARLGPVVSGSNANTRIGALETLTGASGTTAAGNAALSTRLGTGVTTANTATAQLAALQALTTDTVTSPGGIGNQRLADRLGSGVGTGADVTTGSATSQLGNLRSRIVTLEGASTGVVPYFHGYSTAGQSVTSAAYVPIALSQETVDNTNGHSGATNNSRWVPGTLGWYECIGVLLFQEGPAAYAANQVGGRIQKNGAAQTQAPFMGVFPIPDTTANFPTTAWIFGMIQITNVTDYIELAAISSYSTNTIAGSSLRCRWVSA